MFLVTVLPVAGTMSASVGVRDGYRGVRAGWVYRGEYYPATAREGAEPSTSGAGPGSPSGLEWVGTGGWDRPLRASELQDPPCGPGQTLQGPPWSWTSPRANAASWPIRARNGPIFSKVSKNDEVSPKYVEKASVSPCFTKRVRKVTSWNSQISVWPCLLSQGINGPF